MKTKIVLFFVVLMLISCNKEEDQIRYCVSDNEKEIVLKERQADSPWVPYEQTLSKADFSPKMLLSFDKCLGRAYKDDFFPVGTIENVTYPVVDIDKISKNKPDYLMQKNLKEGKANRFAYSSFERYIDKSSVTKKINSGFSLNFGLFSIGAKKKMTKIFTNSTLNEKNRVFGELDVTYRHSQYVLQMSSRIKKEIILNYLSTVFLDELYGTTPSELFYNYGGFVLSDFITGGRASVLYTGLHTSNVSESTNEEDMNKDISASYGFKINSSSGGVSGELGLGKNYSNGATSSNNLTSMNVSVKTTGGGTDFVSFTPPIDINNLNINLSGWLSSLNDVNKHSIIDVSDGGLIPLSDFVMEENIKKSLYSYYKSGVTDIQAIQEPFVNIYLSNITGQMGAFTTSLITRFNDEIMLKSEYVYMGQADIYFQNESKRIGNIYGVKVVNNNKLKYNTNINFYKLDESKMSKYVDKANNTIYLLYSIDGKKMGYSIHNDRILDDYVIRSYVNSLSLININPLDLFEYTIVAL